MILVLIPLIKALIVAATFACAAYAATTLAVSLCAKITPFEDGPPPGEAWPELMIGVAAFAGFVFGMFHPVAPAGTVALFAALIGLLVGIWFVDVERGIIPDVFSLPPLAVVLVFAAVRHDPSVLVAVLVPTVPFAAAALLSKGKGMGWGDVKLVALAGAILGFQNALIALTLACLAAMAIARTRGYAKDKPVAFGPYLAVMLGAFTVMGGGPL